MNYDIQLILVQVEVVHIFDKIYYLQRNEILLFSIWIDSQAYN